MTRRTTERKTPRLADNTAYDLWTALHEGERCAVCLVVERMVALYFDRVTEEAVNDVELRAKLRAAGGFCAPHGKQWQALNDVLGTALIYNDVLSTALGVIRSGGAGAGPDEGGMMGRLRGMLGSGAANGPGSALADALEPTAPCPVCAYTLQAEAQVVGSFARAAEQHAEFRTAFAAHPVALCMPHFRSVLRQTTKHASQLAEAHAHRLAQATADLTEVIRKADYRYRDEVRGEEFAAPRRSVEQAAGALPTQIKPPR
jgi:hypothetical protein